MGEKDQLLETPTQEADAFIYTDITRVNTSGEHQSWKRIHIDELDKWRGKMIELESLHCYSTIQRFANSVHVAEEPYISPLYFDLDSDSDLQKSLDDARKLKHCICTGLEIENGAEFFFSGNRGFHITIDAELCGFKPFNDLAKVCKYMAVSIADKLTLNTFDATVYSKRRMWRMARTKHGKSGLYKIQLTPAEIGTLGVDDIRELATEPREIEIDI